MTRNSSSTPAGYERCPRCPREIARVHMREQQALAIGIFENGVDAADSVDSDESTGDFLATLLATVHDVRSCACPASLDDGLAVGPAAARRWPNAASPPSAHPARVPGAEERAGAEDVGEQALMRVLDTAFPFFSSGAVPV